MSAGEGYQQMVEIHLTDSVRYDGTKKNFYSMMVHWRIVKDWRP